MAAQIPIRAYGPADNQNFFNKFLTTTETTTVLYKNLILFNLNQYPFRDDWTSPRAPTMGYILYHVRSIKQNQRPSKGLLLPLLMAEYLAPALPVATFMAHAEATYEVRRLVSEILSDANLLAQLTHQLDRAEYNLTTHPMADGTYPNPFTNLVRDVYGNPEVNEWPDNVDMEDDDTFPHIDVCMRILFVIASRAGGRLVVSGLDIIVNAWVSIAKRGTMSDQFINKIRNGIRDDLNQQVYIESEYISAFYKHFGGGIIDEKINQLRTRWMGFLPADALRLNLTLQQLSGSRLTSYISIGRALRMYPDFDWGTIFLIFPTDASNFHAATVAVNGNPYYGFRKELGAARSTLFQNLAYVAKELLIQVNGDVSLRQYRGWKARVAEQGTINVMIDDYLRDRVARMDPNQRDPQHPPHPREADLRALAEDPNHAQMFA